MARYTYKRAFLFTPANLERAIKKLNSPYVWEDGTKDPSEFNFKYQLYSNHIEIFDANEYYNIDYLENKNCMLSERAWGFGFEFEPETEDDIHNQLERAIKKDFGDDKYLEWEDSVRMSVYF